MAAGFSTTRMRITTPLVKFSSFVYRNNMQTVTSLVHARPGLLWFIFIFPSCNAHFAADALFSDSDFMQPVGDDAWHRKGWFPARFTTSGLTECESSLNSEADMLNNNINTRFVFIFDFAINLHSNSLLNALLIMYIKLQRICKFKVFIFKSKLNQSYF